MSCVWLFLMCAMACPATAEDVAISLRLRAQQYEVEIRNSSNRIISINHDMSMAPVIGQLEFRIFRGAERLGMRGDVNADLPNEKSYVSLLPGQYFGGVFDADHLQKMYGMKAGCYLMEVIYFDGKAADFGGYAKKAASNRLRVCLR